MLFWAYIGIFVVVTILVEVEWFGWATLSSIATIIGLSYFNRTQAVTFWHDHSDTIVWGIVAYVSTGVVWSFIKWFIFLMKFKNDFRTVADKFKKVNDLPLDQPIPAGKWMSKFRERHGYAYTTRPLASEHKSQIVAWMSFWPCSIIGYVLNDPIRRIFSFLFNLFRGSYQAMSDHFINDEEFRTDRPIHPEPKSDE